VRTLVEDYNGRAWVEDRVPGNPSMGARLSLCCRRLLLRAKAREISAFSIFYPELIDTQFLLRFETIHVATHPAANSDNTWGIT